MNSIRYTFIKDWDKKVEKVGDSADDDNSKNGDGDKEWSPSSSDAQTNEDNEAGATALTYEDIAEQDDTSEATEVTDSDIETAGSDDDDRDDLTDYENSDMVEYQAAVEAGLEDDERQCWVCFASQDDDPVASWVHPCLCKGTTKWVHQVHKLTMV